MTEKINNIASAGEQVSPYDVAEQAAADSSAAAEDVATEAAATDAAAAEAVVAGQIPVEVVAQEPAPATQAAPEQLPFESAMGSQTSEPAVQASTPMQEFGSHTAEFMKNQQSNLQQVESFEQYQAPQGAPQGQQYVPPTDPQYQTPGSAYGANPYGNSPASSTQPGAKAPTNKKRIGMIIGIVAGAAILLCCICSIVGFLMFIR